ncbi:MAG: UDP-N-acetylmuramoyl-L-alanine--D-glutamate ligase, partial [Bryobacteraceae bacterium]
MEFHDKHVVVIGTKRSGTAAIELLLKEGAHVIAMDADPQPIPELNIPVVPQKPEHLGDPDLIVLSPAVPTDLPMLNEARMEGVPVIGEVELASYFLKGPVIGITGSNGKTTTTALTGHLLRECGVPCQVGGNIGTAVASLISSSREGQWNVLELSSFQLETTFQFQAKLGACLNVTPDHLDRHHTFEAYAAAKGRLFAMQAFDAAAVLNFDDPACRGFAEKAKAQVHWFSATQPVSRGMYLAGEELICDGRPILKRSDVKLRGNHNI